jgi:integrase
MVYKALDYGSIHRTISEIENPKHRALFSILYGTGARVGEVVGGEKNKRIGGLNASDVRIEKQTTGGIVKEFMVIALETEKNRNRPIREIPISTENEPWLCQYIKEYSDQCKVIGTDKLFSYSPRYVRMLSEKIFGTHPHILRHSRATHWTTKFDIPNENLSRLLGHSSAKPTSIYLHLRWHDTAKYL